MPEESRRGSKMGRMKVHAKRDKVEETMKAHEIKAVVNFMGGTSYKLNPIDNLRIIAASSIFGEPSYYRAGDSSKSYLSKMGGLYTDPYRTTVNIFTGAVRNALKYDFQATLGLAVELRNTYNMRLNPAVIFVEAAIHPERANFNQSNPKFMREIGRSIIIRPDDITNQFGYYKYLTHTKQKLPGILKRIWAENLESFNRYQLSKYQTSGMLIDMVRVSHAHSDLIDEMMKSDKVLQLEEKDQTWERLRSDGKSWKEITEAIRISHMALLRNLRGMFKEVNDADFCKKIMEQLKEGVEKGRQFPFRYKSARDAVEYQGDVNHRNIILDGLEECIDIAMVNFPKLSGKVMCLSDNSGSAWGTLTTQYGSAQVAVIDNLSSVMTAYNADEGYVGVFGDELLTIPISKRSGILAQAEKADSKGRNIGQATENGIWIFFNQAIKNREHWDTVFIYSDMQAGHGGLYGLSSSDYKDYIYTKKSGRYIDVLKLVAEYRKRVNPKLNVFSVQTAGYDNSVLPENLYRGAILTGWTGKEALYAQEIINTWDGIENRPTQQ